MGSLDSVLAVHDDDLLLLPVWWIQWWGVLDARGLLAAHLEVC